MLKQSYSVAPPSAAVKTLADEVVEEIIKSGVTFREANDALNLAWDLLESETTPVIRPIHQKDV